MVVTLDFDDIDVMDFTESVSLVKVSVEGLETTYTGITARGRLGPDRLVESGGVQQVERPALWNIQASTLTTGIVPARGDRIVSTSTAMAGTYVVQEAALLTRATRYECQTVKRNDP